MITKEMMFKEFYEEKEKDLKLSTDKKQVFTNRLKYLQEHAVAKKNNPSLYSHLDVKFDKLVEMYSSESPIDSFYLKVFGKTYNEYLYQKQIEDNENEAEEKYYPIN